MTIEQGELVVADILFAEQDSKKRRLALVISGNKYNKTSKDIVVLKVTSKINNSQYSVNLTNDSTIKKALKKESIIRADFPVTIAKQNICLPLKTLRKAIKRKLLEPKAPHLRRFYAKFMMIDKFPENAERFDFDVDKFENDVRNLRRL